MEFTTSPPRYLTSFCLIVRIHCKEGEGSRNVIRERFLISWFSKTGLSSLIKTNSRVLLFSLLGLSLLPFSCNSFRFFNWTCWHNSCKSQLQMQGKNTKDTYDKEDNRKMRRKLNQTHTIVWTSSSIETVCSKETVFLTEMSKNMQMSFAEVSRDYLNAMFTPTWWWWSHKPTYHIFRTTKHISFIS